MTARFSIAPFLILLISLAGACGRDLGTARGVAEEFVDHHYVAIDLQKAKSLAVSIALAKVALDIGQSPLDNILHNTA